MPEHSGLAAFIEQHLDELVADWEAFARAVQPAPARMRPAALRDWARQMLTAIVADLAAERPLAEQAAKARGERPEAAPRLTESARIHAQQRLRHGFDLNQLVAEFRVLRVSVARRWLDRLEGGGDHAALEELVRFDTALDQVLTESIADYAATLERARALLIGVLAHDLRNGASAISAADEVLLLGAERLEEGHVRAAVVIRNSITRLRRLIADLLDFARTRLGSPLALAPTPTDLAALCARVREELAAQYPDRRVVGEYGDALTGIWDCGRSNRCSRICSPMRCATAIRRRR